VSARRLARAAIAATLALFAPWAAACGVCVDDKVAAAYDHAMVMRAIDRGQVVVFAEVKGPGDAAALTQAARRGARRVRGIDGATVRVAQAPAAIAFALDARVRAPEDALGAVRAAASLPGLDLQLLRVLR
jgi:hypothetical protein